MFQFANNQSDVLAAQISALTTQILVETPIPRVVPTASKPILATLVEGSTTEIVWVHAAESQPNSRTLYSVIRGAEGTQPQAFTVAARLEIRFTAASARRGQFDGDTILTQDGDVLTQDGNVLTFSDVSFESTSP